MHLELRVQEPRGPGGLGTGLSPHKTRRDLGEGLPPLRRRLYNGRSNEGRLWTDGTGHPHTTTTVVISIGKSGSEVQVPFNQGQMTPLRSKVALRIWFWKLDCIFELYFLSTLKLHQRTRFKLRSFQQFSMMTVIFWPAVRLVAFFCVSVTYVKRDQWLQRSFRFLEQQQHLPTFRCWISLATTEAIVFVEVEVGLDTNPCFESCSTISEADPSIEDFLELEFNMSLLRFIRRQRLTHLFSNLESGARFMTISVCSKMCNELSLTSSSWISSIPGTGWTSGPLLPKQESFPQILKRAWRCRVRVFPLPFSMGPDMETTSGGGTMLMLRLGRSPCLMDAPAAWDLLTE